MPCLTIPSDSTGARLARCGTLRPLRSAGSLSDTSSESPRNNDVVASTSSTTSSTMSDRPALPSSMTAPTTSKQIRNEGAYSPMRNQQEAAAAITSMLAVSPRRINQSQLDSLDSSGMPVLPLSSSSSSTSSSTSTSQHAVGATRSIDCPPHLHGWMARCIDGAAVGRDPRAERMCLAVRERFALCSRQNASM